LVNTITAVLEAQRHHTTREERKTEPPKKYALVLHAKPGDGIALNLALHVLTDHANVDDETAEEAVETAYKAGKAIVKPITKDIGDSIVAQCQRCRLAVLGEFKISCEQI
jgi:ATP-dependent Clp protease adapter protein ClpS